MAILNRNNFLIWEGSFEPSPQMTQAIDDLVSAVQNAPLIEISPLLNDVATYGIDETSLLITLQTNLTTPATWDPVTKKITFYPNAGQGVEEIEVLKYKWKDTQGTFSNEAPISVNFTARPTGWRGYASSRVCLQESGDNTGEAFFDQLEKYYTDDNTAFLPQELKTNVDTDPDYIAPVVDSISCPLPGATQDFKIYNFSLPVRSNPAPIIKNITFFPDGGGFLSFSLNHKASDLQPRIIQVPTGLYPSIEVEVQYVPAAINLSIEPGTGGSASQSQVAYTPGVIPLTMLFEDVTIGTDPLLELSL